MIYRSFQEKQLSLLGFGAMRLPLLEDGAIDEQQVFRMVAYAAEHGVNYFDTAYPYHGGLSEIVLGRALKQLPRESYYLATKYPGHQIATTYDPADVFEEQLRKCEVDYFDFYLLHNVYENSLDTYLDPRWGIIPYFLEQKKAGRIKHLGFSTHAHMDCLQQFLQEAGQHMEFCQIQMNYLDWSVQQAQEKIALLQDYNIPVWVMEPVRGGKLAALSEEATTLLEAAAPGRTAADWALRWQIDKPVTVVLSGMSNMAQVEENCATFEAEAPLSAAEDALLYQVAESMKNGVPCTACRYCCDSCPLGLDIPLLMNIANEVRVAPSFNAGMTIDALGEGKRPQDCLACGACAAACPQSINIPEVLAQTVTAMEGVPHWADLCKQREEAARKLREGN
ncbi:MAG: aldo/keto reductase [Coriobacteriia bacterium]|nr:aldo/keto reductase [Coriobacteriia bacterium]